MWIQFYLQHAYFSLHIFTFLVFVAVAWLYADAWTNKRRLKEGLRTSGFFFAGLSYFLSALSLDQALVNALILCIRIVGFALISYSLLIDPLQPIPINEGIKETRKKPGLSLSPMVLPFLVPLSHFLIVLSPLSVAAAAYLFFKRATTGLERHLLPIAISFLFFCLSEIISLRQFGIQNDSLTLYELIRPYGILWIIQYLLLGLGTVSLARWIFSYLIKRIETELTLILTSIIVVIFLTTTIVFTALLVRQIRQTVLSQLTSDASVLLYAIESKQAEVAAEVSALAESEQLKAWVSQGNRREILPLLATTMKTRQLTTLMITNPQGSLIAHGEKPDIYGIAIPEDYFLRQAANKQPHAGFITQEGATAPSLLVKASAPILVNQQVIGVIVATYTVDSAFLRGVKTKTGLESSLYTDSRLSATSVTNRFQETPPLGIVETNKTILNRVLSQQTPYTGTTRFFAMTYLSSYLPIRDSNNNTIGMLAVSKPERQIINTAQHSIRLTFLFTSLLIAGSLIPAYQIGAMIRKQLQ